MILVFSERRPDGEGNIASRLPRFDIDPLPDSVAGFIPLRRLPSTIVTLISLFLVLTQHRSNDYSQNDCKSNLKAILLNKVVVGKGHKLTHDLTSLTAPPHGFDSVRLQILCIMIKVHFFLFQVLAERGGSLNYDELVVYTNDAIRPSFLVMYEL